MNKPVSGGQLAEQISAGIEALGQQPGQHPIASYVTYLQLLMQWNKAYNLTAIRTPETMVSHHVLDSLAVLPYLRGNHGLDVGTGAGLPGFILALARPDMRWVLLDSRRKKIRFITQAIMELRVTNVETVCVRAEAYRPEALFTTVITRAFGSLHKFYANTKHLLAPAGSLLAMKGNDPGSELTELTMGTVTVQVHTFNVPGISELRSVVEIRAS